MRRSDKQAAGRGHDSRDVGAREARASTRPAASIPPALETAISAADLMLREPTDDHERVAVFCRALGGGFIWSREETERRIILKFPDLAFNDVAASALFLEDRIRVFLKPIHTESRRKSSWIHGWRE